MQGGSVTECLLIPQTLVEIAGEQFRFSSLYSFGCILTEDLRHFKADYLQINESHINAFVLDFRAIPS